MCIRDSLNGLSSEEFLKALSKNFDVVEKGSDIYKPNHLHNFSLYLDNKWYRDVYKRQDIASIN